MRAARCHIGAELLVGDEGVAVGQEALLGHLRADEGTAKKVRRKRRRRRRRSEGTAKVRHVRRRDMERRLMVCLGWKVKGSRRAGGVRGCGGEGAACGRAARGRVCTIGAAVGEGQER